LFVPVWPGPHFDADPLIELAEILAGRGLGKLDRRSQLLDVRLRA